MTTESIQQFDYSPLDAETRIVVQQEDKEFDQHMSASGTSFMAACKNVQRIHEALRYKSPGFVEYCRSKPGLSQQTANRMIAVANMLLESGNIPAIASREVLYLLASSSTPHDAKEEIVSRAQAGEVITNAKAKEIAQAHAQHEEETRLVDLPPVTRDWYLKKLAAKRLRWNASGPDFIDVARDIEFKDDAKERHRLIRVADALALLKLPVPPAPPSRWAQPVDSLSAPDAPDAPGVRTLKALKWRLDTRIPPDKYRMLPPDGGEAEVLTDAECMARAEVYAAEVAAKHAAMMHLPEDFGEVQAQLGEHGHVSMDSRTGEFALHVGSAVEYFKHDRWWGVRSRVALLTDARPASSLPEDFHAIQQQYRGVATVAVRSDGGFQLFPLGGQIERLDTWDAVLRRLVYHQSRTASPALPSPPPGWSIWQDGDGTIGMAHDCGIKLRGTSPERLIADAQEMTRWIERLTGWSVTLDIAGTGWQASHKEHGQVFADDLPDLALKTFWQAATAKDLPDMPDQVISAAFLAGWRYIRTEADRNIYEKPDGIRGSFTLGELEYELGLPESPAAPAAGSQDVLTADDKVSPRDSLRALEDTISIAKARGYTFTRLDECLGVYPYHT
jgi:hypothetical protein